MHIFHDLRCSLNWLLPKSCAYTHNKYSIAKNIVILCILNCACVTLALLFFNQIQFSLGHSVLLFLFWFLVFFLSLQNDALLYLPHIKTNIMYRYWIYIIKHLIYLIFIYITIYFLTLFLEEKQSFFGKIRLFIVCDKLLKKYNYD